MNVALNLAAAAGGAAARVAMDRLSGWAVRAPQPLNTMGEMRVALPRPGPSRGRGRGRRGRGRRGRGARQGGQPPAGVSTRGQGMSVATDTEILVSVAQGFKAYVFNPSPPELVRLKAMEQMYTRYRVRYVNVAYKSTSGTATAGSVAVGIAAGPQLPADMVKDATTIMKLRPSFVVPAWKNDSLTIGADIDLGRYMLCGDKTPDGVAFTLYVNSTAADLGMIQVSYRVEFTQPKPF